MGSGLNGCRESGLCLRVCLTVNPHSMAPLPCWSQTRRVESRVPPRGVGHLLGVEGVPRTGGGKGHRERVIPRAQWTGRVRAGRFLSPEEGAPRGEKGEGFRRGGHPMRGGRQCWPEISLRHFQLFKKTRISLKCFGGKMVRDVLYCHMKN